MIKAFMVGLLLLAAMSAFNFACEGDPFTLF